METMKIVRLKLIPRDKGASAFIVDADNDPVHNDTVVDCIQLWEHDDMPRWFYVTVRPGHTIHVNPQSVAWYEMKADDDE